MTEAYQCDGCGEFSTKEPTSVLSAKNSASNVPVMGHGHIKEGTYEFCRQCSEQFIAWVDNDR